MTTKNDENRNALVICQLMLERCRNHVAHLRALMHLCQPSGLGMDPVAADTAHDILTQVEAALSKGSRILEQCE